MARKDNQSRLIEDYNRQHYLKIFYVAIIELAMFIFRIDPFAIYKRSHLRADGGKRYQLQQPNSLRLQHSNLDRWRNRWHLIVATLVAYYSLKFAAIIWVQVVLHATSRRKSTESSNDWLALISHLLGNPLIDYTGMTIFLYSVYIAWLSYVMFYLPYHYKLRPQDSVTIRLWIEPEREFKRIDFSLLEEFNKYSQPYRLTCYCVLKNWQSQSMVEPQDALIASRRLQVQAVELFRRHYWHLRPITYTLDWYKAFDRFTIYVSVPAIGLFAFSIYYIAHYIDGANQQLAGYTSFQTITFIEITCGLLFVTPTILLLIIIFFTECYSQLSLLGDTKRQLLACLEHLKRQTTRASGTREIDHLTTICILLKPLIRISLSLKELRSNARTLTEMVSVNMVISGTTCVFILLAENLDGQDLHLLRVIIIIGLWCWANLTLLGCAYVFISATKLEKITWSLLAELRLRDSRKDRVIFEFQVAEQWRRLIFNRNFSDPRLSVRPFGATLNYSRALQLNFLAISFAVLLKNF